jgi:hypothetical protein
MLNRSCNFAGGPFVGTRPEFFFLRIVVSVLALSFFSWALRVILILFILSSHDFLDMLKELSLRERFGVVSRLVRGGWQPQ